MTTDHDLVREELAKLDQKYAELAAKAMKVRDTAMAEHWTRVALARHCEELRERLTFALTQAAESGDERNRMARENAELRERLESAEQDTARLRHLRAYLVMDPIEGAIWHGRRADGGWTMCATAEEAVSIYGITKNAARAPDEENPDAE